MASETELPLSSVALQFSFSWFCRISGIAVPVPETEWFFSREGERTVTSGTELFCRPCLQCSFLPFPQSYRSSGIACKLLCSSLDDSPKLLPESLSACLSSPLLPTVMRHQRARSLNLLKTVRAMPVSLQLTHQSCQSHAQCSA